MKGKGFWIIVAVILAGTVGLIINANRSAKPNTVADAEALGHVQADDHVRGKLDSNIVLIEYGDIECPACAQYNPLVEALYAEYSDRVAFVFRHSPLTNIHPRAIVAARAVEAAGRQNAFFEMANLMFSDRKSWNTADNPDLDPAPIFESYATSLGLDAEQFKRDSEASNTFDFIDSQSKAGTKAYGINSTPTFILNGKKIDNPQSYEEFRQLIETALTQTSAS